MTIFFRTPAGLIASGVFIIGLFVLMGGIQMLGVAAIAAAIIASRCIIPAPLFLRRIVSVSRLGLVRPAIGLFAIAAPTQPVSKRRPRASFQARQFHCVRFAGNPQRVVTLHPEGVHLSASIH